MTEEPAAEPETVAAQTAVVPSAVSEDAALAWSADDDIEDDTTDAEGRWRHRLRWASAVTLLCATSVAAAWLGTALYREQFDLPRETAPKAVPEVPPVSAAAKPPPEAPPPATPSLPSLPPADHEAAPQPTARPEPSVSTVAAPLPDPPAGAYETYVELMARDGILATDSPKVALNEAYWACRARATGDAAATDALIQKSEKKSPLLSRAQIQAALADIVQAYCPEYDNG